MDSWLSPLVDLLLELGRRLSYQKDLQSWKNLVALCTLCMYTRVRVKTFNILIPVHFTVETKLGEVMSLNFSYIQN